ncbi:hypothetical protein AB0O00_20240, partial [Kitasatospora sp. NPDC093558]
MTAPIAPLAHPVRAAVDAGVVPGPDEARALAAEHAYVPLYLELLADTLSPVTAFARLCGPELDEPGLLLESVVGTLVAIPMGLTDFSSVGGADWFGLASPFHF